LYFKIVDFTGQFAAKARRVKCANSPYPTPTGAEALPHLANG
jgi:hypothetical protein